MKLETTGITEVTIRRTINEIRKATGGRPTAREVAVSMVPEFPRRRRQAWNIVYAFAAGAGCL